MATYDFNSNFIKAARLNGETWAEIAETYGCPTASVRGWYSRNKDLDTVSMEVNVVPPEFPDYKWPENSNWREYFKIWDDLLGMYQAADPFCRQLNITLDVDHPIGIVSASDLHLGGGFTSHKQLTDFFEYLLKTPDLYIGITGDTIEGFIAGQKSVETTEQMAAPTKAQLWALESLVAELVESKKLLWFTWGDHDAKWFEQTIGVNIVKNMVHNDVPYFIGRGLISLNVGSERYYILTNHAERFRSQWSKTHSQRRAYDSYFPADVVIAGHTHRPEFRMMWHYEQLRDMGIPVGGKSWLVQNGTFKTGPDPYTIRAFSGGIIGTPTLVFDPDSHDVDCFETPAKAVQYMNGQPNEALARMEAQLQEDLSRG